MRCLEGTLEEEDGPFLSTGTHWVLKIRLMKSSVGGDSSVLVIKMAVLWLPNRWSVRRILWRTVNDPPLWRILTSRWPNVVQNESLEGSEHDSSRSAEPFYFSLRST